jgi:hypothetical protein
VLRKLRDIVAAQHFSQILSPDAPLLFEKSGLGDLLLRLPAARSLSRSTDIRD